MKKSWIILIIMLLGLTVAITACGNNDYHHEHLIVKHEYRDATCEYDGNDIYYECKKCHALFLDENGETPIEYKDVAKEKLAHTISEKWYMDEYNHYKFCENCGERLNIDAHNYGSDNLCDICGFEKPSEGLQYKPNRDGVSYSVVGIGTCNDENIIIPSTYKNEPVTTIGRQAFSNCNIRRIKLPESLLSIGEFAFDNCKNIQSLNLPNSVTTIELGAFNNCTNLQNIDINNVTSIGGGAFYGCSSLQSIDLRNVKNIEAGAFDGCSSLQSVDLSNVESIEDRIFYNCTNLQSVKWGENLTTITDSMFYNCASLQSIKISDSVTRIEKEAFWGCINLQSIDIPTSVVYLDNHFASDIQTIFYRGTKLEWEKLNCTISATIYVYSERDPKYNTSYDPDFNYYYYNDQGEIVVWEK